ncbi:hypothetical protein ZYGM_000339 [Zygosaccharomyces mellis]|uniref:Uncharacterized protein n=1 Tax=Zygosaccharomyces mellis TaxID=42258 RepID=A0A4C2E8N7_9SACH|nr:hypothetical protein ZYGM_000339 [Zygosaccharomyces mellis]
MGRSINQNIKETSPTNTVAFSRRSKLTLNLRERINKIKEFCHPIECTTSQYFHHFRRWKNPKHTYNFKDSAPHLGKEFVITPEKNEEKKREYESDVKRMISLRKIKHRDPEQYKMGCMILKWYFENKGRESKSDQITGNTNDKLFNEYQEQQKDTFHDNHRTLKPVSAKANTESFNNNLKLPLNKKGGSQRQTKFRSIDPSCRQLQESFESEFEDDKSTANERILDDLVHLIDDYFVDIN